MTDGARKRPMKKYVQLRDGGYWVADTRISLDSIVHAFRRGAAPESIQRAFPVLTLEEVYGALAFYLGHAKEVDAYLAEADAAFASQARELNAAAQARNPRLFERLLGERRLRETPSQQ